MHRFIAALFTVLSLIGRAYAEVPTYTYKIINTYRHNPDFYTEGLVIEEGFLYEGTGLNGKSKLLKAQLPSGKTVQQRDLEARYFGEGITVLKDEVYQLTYKEGIGFVYDKNSFERKATFVYSGEGWGLTTDGRYLIMSNGSSELIFLDPLTFKESRRIRVSDNKGEVKLLNELEYINGSIYANIYLTHLIAIVSSETGKVTGWLDLSGINSAAWEREFPNGIAYDKNTGRLFVTGKNWSKIYEIEMVRYE